MTQKEQLEELLTSAGVGFRSNSTEVTLDSECSRVSAVGLYSFCNFEFDAGGKLLHVNVGE